MASQPGDTSAKRPTTLSDVDVGDWVPSLPSPAYERTAAEDEGFDATTAADLATIGAIDIFCIAEANAEVLEVSLDTLVCAADLAERALEADGAGDEQFKHIFAPRFPFDVLAGETERVTTADLFLARFEADLPKDAVRAVKALISAEAGDAVACATWEGKKVTIEYLSASRALPGPGLWRRGTRPYFCRLVRFGYVHVPLAVERFEDRTNVETLLEEIKVASGVARDVLKAGEIRLRSTKKGFGLGARLLTVPDES